MKKYILLLILYFQFQNTSAQKTFFIDIGLDFLKSKDVPAVQYGLAILPRINFTKFEKTSFSFGGELGGFIFKDSATNERSINYRGTLLFEYNYGFGSGAKNIDTDKFGFSIGTGFGVFLIGTDKFGGTIGQGPEGTLALKLIKHM